MKYKEYCFIIAYFLLIPNAFAIETLTVGKYLQSKYAKDKTESEIIETYIAGIGQGILFGSVYSSQILRNKPLICPPTGLKITGYTALEILDDAIKNSPISVSDVDVSVVITVAFVKRFPCSK